MVDACADTERMLRDAAFADAGLALESAGDAAAAITRLEDAAEAVDVVLLAPRLPDPVRVAQRLHSLDRQGSVVILAQPDRVAEVRHSLDVAPFLDGDVALVDTTDAAALAHELTDAVARTRARRAEQAERKRRRDTPPPLSARYLGTLLDSAPIGIVTLDAASAVIGWNRRAGEMLGVAEVEALGTPFAELFDETQRGELESLIAGLTSSGIGGEHRVVERGAHSFEVSGARFAIRSGEVGTLLILQDVTARIATERALRLQTALLEAQAESAIAGIAIVDLGGRFERVNRRFEELWGIAEEEIRSDTQGALQRMLEQTVEPDEFLAGVDALVNNPGADFADELSLRDGRTLERYGAHLRTDDGELIGRIWFYTDISARKHDEESLRFLADATNLLSSSLDYETTLERVAELAVPRIADWCAVEVGDKTDQRSVAIAHSDPAKVALARELRERYPSDPDSGAVSTAIRTGESQLFPDIPPEALAQSARDEDHLRMLQAIAPRSAMIVPIKVRGRIFGAITFMSSESARRYGDDDLAFAEELARRAAIAIDNSRVHAELRQTARTLQESLLPPHLPAIERVELAARFRAAGAGMQVGGDFYDIFETGEGRWGIAVGDVCGKGAEAAALTALSRYTVRAAAMYEQTTGGVLAVLNNALLRQRADFRFTTLTYCLLDVGVTPCSLRVASGGHPRPLHLRPDGSAQVVGGAGPLLGVMPGARFPEEEILLEDGSVLVLYTDGLTDAHAPERQLDEAQLLETLQDCAGLGAGEIALRMEAAAVGDSSEPPRDDIALLVLRLGT